MLKDGKTKRFFSFKTGGIFIVCACWICPWFWEQYLKVNLKTERYVVIVVISFTIGLILQEIGVFWDKKIGHIEENVLSNFLSRNAIFTIMRASEETAESCFV